MKITSTSYLESTLLGPITTGPETRKIVVNWGGWFFGLSEAAKARYLELKYPGISDEEFDYSSIERDDPILVRVVEEMGEGANSEYSLLRITEIPADVEGWYIYIDGDYDCHEYVVEDHRMW